MESFLKTEFGYSVIDDFECFSSIEFDMTASCNLKCSYCYLEGRNNPLGLSIDTVDYFIDKYVEPNIRKTKVITVYFWGGEPLIKFKEIKYIVDRFEKLKKNCILKYIIVTNGTLITHDIAQFCAKKSFILQITMDGTKMSHDKNRKQINGKGSYEIIINSLRILNAHNTKYYIRTTLTHEIGSINSIIEDYYKLDIDNVVFGIVSETSTFKAKSQNIYAAKFADEIFDLYRSNCKIQISNVDDFIAIFFANTYRKTCGVGIQKVTVGMDGRLYPCHRFVTNDKLSIGSVEEGLFKKGLSTTEIIEFCHVCQWRHFCGGCCLYVIMVYKKSPKQTGTCIFTQRLFYHIAKYLVDLYFNNHVEFDKIANKYGCKTYSQNIPPIRCLNIPEMITKILKKNVELNIIDLDTEGIAYRTDHFDKKYILNVLSMAILDLVDGKRTNQEIVQEIATVCEIPLIKIEKDIYQQIATFKELGFVEEVKETA